MIDFYAGVPGLQIANPIPNPGVLLNIVWRVLHMKDETLALAYAYLERSLKAKIPTKTFSGPQIDAHTLALTCLHLAAKMTDFPQPLPKILIVAWRLLRRGAPGPFPPLEQCSSSRLADCPLFCSLRNAIDATETLLLRILAFDIHFDTPVQYDQMYLARALLVAGAKSQDPNEDDSNPTTSDGVELEPPLEKGEENGTEAPLHGGDERGRTLIENLPTHIIQQIRGSSQQIRWLSLQACKHKTLSAFSAKVLAMAAVFTVLSENRLAPPFVDPLDADMDKAYLDLKAWTRAVYSKELQTHEAKEFFQAVWCMRGILSSATGQAPFSKSTVRETTDGRMDGCGEGEGEKETKKEREAG